MYNVKDNAEAKLQVGLSSLATTLVVELGNGMLFPDAPFIAVLNKRDSDGKITKSEKVEVTAKDGDQFTVNRGYEGTTPQDFNAGDFFSLFVLAKHIQELQERSEYSAKDTAIANEYNPNSTYSVGSIVMYKGDRYRCTTAVSTAEEFNSNKWTKISVQSDLSTISSNLSSVTSTVNDITTNGVPTSVLKKQMIAGEAFTSGTHIGRLGNHREEDALLAYSIATTGSVYTYANSSGVSSNQISFYASKSDSWTTISDLLVTVGSLTGTVSFNSIGTTRTKVTVTLNGNMNYSKGSSITIKFSLSTTTADGTFYLYMDPFNYYPSGSQEIYIRANEVGINSNSGDSFYALCDFGQNEYCQISYSSSRTPSTHYSDDGTTWTSGNSGAHRYRRLTRYTSSYSASNIIFKFRRYLRIMTWSNSFSTEVLFKANTGLSETTVQADVIAGGTGSLTLGAITQIATGTFTPTLSGYYDISIPGNTFYTSFVPTTEFEKMQNRQYLVEGKTYTIYLYGLGDRVTSGGNYSYGAVSIVRRCNGLGDRPYMPISNVSSGAVGNFAIQGFVDKMPEIGGFLCSTLGDRYGVINLGEKGFFGGKEEYYEKVKAYKIYASNYATATKRSDRIFSSANYNF